MLYSDIGSDYVHVTPEDGTDDTMGLTGDADGVRQGAVASGAAATNSAVVEENDLTALASPSGTVGSGVSTSSSGSAVSGCSPFVHVKKKPAISNGAVSSSADFIRSFDIQESHRLRCGYHWYRCEKRE